MCVITLIDENLHDEEIPLLVAIKKTKLTGNSEAPVIG